MAVKVKQHKGKYWVFIDHKGKRKAKCVGSKQAAETAAKKIEAKLTLGDYSLLEDEKPQRPFDAYFQGWLDTYVQAQCKERTYAIYEQALRCHLFPYFGQKDITAITREDVKKLAYDLLAKGKSRGTVMVTLAPLREMFNHAIEDRHVTVNPAHGIMRLTRKGKGEQREKVTFLTREEIPVLLETCRKYFPAYAPLILLLVRTGLRIGEACALQWTDLDLLNRSIDVRRTYSNGRIEETTKSSKRRRGDMSLQLTETLKALLVERKKETERVG